MNDNDLHLNAVRTFVYFNKHFMQYGNDMTIQNKLFENVSQFNT